MRAGRAVDSAITADSDEAQVIAYLPGDRMLRGFVEAFMVAAGKGNLANRLPGQTTFRSAHVHATIDTIAQQIVDLEGVIKESHQRAARAMELALTCESPDEALLYQEKSREARLAASKATDEIEALRATAARSAPTGPFDAYTDVIVPAIRRIATCGNRVSQEEATALRSLLPEFRMEKRDGQWWAATAVRLNTHDGVAELGPIEWCVGNGGRGTQALRERIESVPNSGGNSRNILREQLLGGAGISHPATATLLNSPFTQLPHVVLHHRLGTDFPDWVGEEWREPKFGTWVTDVYSNPEFQWLGNGKYAQVSHVRQAVLTLLSAKGTQKIGALMEDLPISRIHDLQRLTRQHLEKGQKVRPWQPSVKYPFGGARGGVGTWTPLSCFKCDCGGVADIAVRVPEVPSDVLCGCGAVPRPAVFGIDPAIRFPAEYLALRLPMTECMAELDRRFAARVAKLNRTLRSLMCGGYQLLKVGASSYEISQHLGLQDGFLSLTLRELEQLRLVERSYSRPAMWKFTDAGRKRADELLEELTRTTGSA